jgi:hypothetical protein
MRTALKQLSSLITIVPGVYISPSFCIHLMHLRFPHHSVRLFEEVQSLSLLLCGAGAVKFSDAA